MSSFQAIEDYTRRLKDTQDKARKVALNGAVKAFDHPSAATPLHIPGRDSGAFAAANAASGRTPTTPLHPDDHLLASSHASSAASHAFPRSLEKQPISRSASPLRQPARTHSPRNPSRRSSAHSLGVPPSDTSTARGKSPSNIAAVLAASRFVPRTQAATLSARPKSWVIDASLLHRPHSPLPDLEQDTHDDADNEDENEPPAELPPSGTVHGVRSWLEALEPPEEATKTPKHVLEPAPIINRRRRPKTMDLSGISANADSRRPLIDKEIVSIASAAKLRSPKPVRVSSVRTNTTASSLETSVLSDERRKSSATIRPRVPSKSEAVRKLSISLPKPAEAAPEVDSPEDAEYKTPPLFPEQSVISPRSIISLNRALSQKTKPELPPPRRSEKTEVVESKPSEPPKQPARETPGPLAVKTPERSFNLEVPQRRSADMARTLSPYTQASASPSALHGGLAAVAAAHSPYHTSPSNVPFQQRRVSPHMTGDSLANAIVAGSIASSRAPSPIKANTTGASRRSVDRPRTPFDHFKRNQADNRTPSPGKYTFRKMHSSDEETLPRAYKVSRNFLGLKQHPNKHREGDRKRWKWEISAVERKRYEGVWAANKGLLLLEAYREPDSEDLADEELREWVCNLVVRDIWKRSRLPEHVLEEVWELVDRSQVRRLDREEFVVGLWLIDQRLMGKKLPHKVSESVWNSARGTGVRIPSFSK